MTPGCSVMDRAPVGVSKPEARAIDPARLGDHVDRLFRAAWAMCGSREDAEDLVQDTYAQVLARPRFLRNDDDLGYLLRALRNTFATSLRTASRRPVAALGDPEGPEPVDERSSWRPDEAFETGRVFSAIAELPDVYRAALVAVDICGLSYGEAAAALGTREATITSRLFRARGQVAAALGA